MKVLLTDPVVIICSGVILIGIIAFFWALGKFRDTGEDSYEVEESTTDGLLPPVSDIPGLDFRAPDLTARTSVGTAPAVSKDVSDRLESMSQRLLEMQTVLNKQPTGTSAAGGVGQGFSPETVEKLLKIIGNVIQQVDVLQKELEYSEMKKFFLGLFMAVDLGLVGGSIFVLVTYLRTHKPVPTSFSGSVATPAPVSAVAESTTTPKGVGAGFLTSKTPAESSVRKILFSYRNPKAKVVSIRADFTGWKAEPMLKAASGMWTYQGQLTPGEYAYCFTVDDKTFKDPANKRTKLIGRTTVSAIVVEALPVKAVN